MGPLRVGVIGVGRLGKFHAQKYYDLPGVELVAAVDIREERAQEVARQYNALACTDFHDILDMVDAVSVAVPTESHYEVGRDVLAAGCHLLMEKPITYDLSHADQLIEMANEKGLVLQVGHIERFNPAVKKLEALLTQPIFIESHRLNLFTTRGTDVDVVLDLMIHDLDIVAHIVPSEVKELHAVGMSVITGKIDIANVRIIFANGTVANLTASRVANKNLRKIRIFQPDAYISVDCLNRKIGVTRLENHEQDHEGLPQVNTTKLEYPGSDPLRDQVYSFVNSVKDGKTPVVSGEDARKALWVAHNIIDQIKRGARDFQTIC